MDKPRFLNLAVREGTCRDCHHLGRDKNAAKNILNEELEIIGWIDNTD